jgi:hypothetical protein
VFDLPGEEGLLRKRGLGMLDGALMISAWPLLAEADMQPRRDDAAFGPSQHVTRNTWCAATAQALPACFGM